MLVEQREEVVPPDRGHGQDAARDAEVVHRSESVRVTGCPEERDLDGPRIASLGGRLLVQRADGSGEVAKGEPDRYPAVAVVDDAREALARRAPQVDRRLPLLEELWAIPVEVWRAGVAAEASVIRRQDAPPLPA